MPFHKTSLLCLAFFVSTGVYQCASDDVDHTEPDWEWHLPAGFPQPWVPEDNPMSKSKVQLGRKLFFDTQLSGNQTQSCASCHNPELAFTDGVPLSLGSTNEPTLHNSPSLINAAYAATLQWANPLIRTLEDQALLPMFNETPVELGLSGKESELLDRLRTDQGYSQLFADAFPHVSEPISVEHVVHALASYERTLISGSSPYDRYIAGDEASLSSDAKQGMELFFSEKVECFHCHGGFNLSLSVDHKGVVFDQATFHNNGLYNLDAEGSYPPGNQGLYEFTFDPADKGKFKPPTLRNIALTAPYMHDGSIATLEEVLAHYAAGGRVISDGPNAGDGRANPNKSAFVRGFELSEEEERALLAFLISLTDAQLPQ